MILVRGARAGGGRPVRPVRGTAARLAVCGQRLALMRWQRAGRAGHGVPSAQGRGAPGHHPAWRSALPRGPSARYRQPEHPGLRPLPGKQFRRHEAVPGQAYRGTYRPAGQYCPGVILVT